MPKTPAPRTLGVGRAKDVPAKGEPKVGRRVVKLGDGRRRIRTAHCPTCKRRVLLRRPWVGFRYLRALWLVLLLPVLAYLPSIASQRGAAMIGLFAFLMALGPLTLLARRPPSCARCGASLPGALADGPIRADPAPVVPLSSRRSKRRSSP
jgi:hypothetical protein